MSEYQFVYFAAVDRALDDQQLAYMRKQSSRAVVTRWQFENQYHYGDFRGNALEMMRRGYDVHLHYANFGIRKLMFRLPQGLPIAADVFEAFAIEDCPEWTPDARGKGGVLSISPEGDAGTYYEDYFEFDRLTEVLPQIRGALIAGDLRPLYVAWLACVWDDDVVEPPVPGGLKTLPHDLKELAAFYELSPDLIAAAAKIAPAAPSQGDPNKLVDSWLQQCSADELRSWLRRVVDGEGASVQAEILATVRSEQPGATWPIAAAKRTYGELQALAEEIGSVRVQREAQAQERARLKRLKALAADPDAAIAKAQQLVERRSTEEYEQAAALLAELREALGSSGAGPRRADAAARNLARQYPTLNRLKRALREQGLNYK